MKITSSPVIRTERLILRPPQLEDAEAIFQRYAQDAEVTRYLIWSPHQSIAETEMFLRDCIAALDDGSRFLWVIIRNTDCSLLGMIEMRLDGQQANVGYVLARPEWGKGYMTEALRAVIDFAFSLPDVRRVWAVCDTENVASACVMQKAGMVKEGILSRYILHPNVGDEPRDVYCYAISR